MMYNSQNIQTFAIQIGKMKISRKSAFFTCFLSILLTLNIQAQDETTPVFNYGDPGQYTIAGVEIIGAENRDRNAIKSITGLRVGKTIEIPGDDIPKAIKSLWRLRLFEDVQIYQTKVEEGNNIYLEIRITERPTLSRYAFRGTKKIYHDDLNEKLEGIITKGSIVTEDMKDLASIKIKEYFVDKGFTDTEVKIIEEKDESSDNAVKLFFEIERNERLKISRIDFANNQHASDGKLRRKMKNIKKKNTILKKSRFEKDEFKEDKNSVIAFYNTLGYRDAKFVSDTMYRDLNNELVIKLVIDEGERYYFGDITWQGNTKYTDDQLTTILGIKQGEIYNPEVLEKRLRFSLDSRDVSSLYLDDGYLFFDIDAVENSINDDNAIALKMVIYEGPQATIDKVNIMGNDRTHEHVIRRELRTKPGQKFSRSDIIRSQRQIMNLGYFNPETIDIQPQANQQRGTVDIDYTVEERPSDQLELSAGYGGFSGLIGTLGMTFNNFSVKNFKDRSTWSPMPQGDGQKLSVRGQSNGQFFSSLNATFTDPWLGGKKPNSFTIGVVWSQFNYSLLGRGDLSILRGFVGLGSQLKWPDDFFSTSTTLTVEQITMNDYSAQLSRFAVDHNNRLVDIKTGNFSNISLRQVISRSSIGEPLYPRRGSRVSLSVQLTPPYSLFRKGDYWTLTSEEKQDVIDREIKARGSGYVPTQAELTEFVDRAEASIKFKFLEYHKWRFDAEWYYNIVDKLVFTANAKIGLLGYYDKNIGISPFERFQLGGDGLSNQQVGITGRDILALRGYEDTDIRANNEGGATVFSKYTMELRYPISLNPSSTIFGLLFVQGGNAEIGFKNFNPFELQRSAGIGARVFLPMFGLLGFNYGWGFDKTQNFGALHVILGFEPD